MASLTERPVLIGTAADITATDGALYGEGALAYATDTNQAYRYTGTAWATEADADTVNTALSTHIADSSDAHPEITALNSYLPKYNTLTADSTTLTTVTDPTLTPNPLLTVTLPSTGTYNVEAMLVYTTDAASDFRVKFGGTSTVTATVGTSDLYYAQGPLIGGDATSPTVKPVLIATSWTTAHDITTTGAPSAFPTLFRGTLVVTAVGTITVGCAQVSSTGFDTKLNKSSYLKVIRVG